MATSLGKVGIVDKGNYSSEEIYNSGDFVFYEGSSWLAIKDGLMGIEPVEGENWKYLARGLANGIATPNKAGVVKPSNDFIVEEDGTLGLNTTFETIAERANIQSGDTWGTVLSKINKTFGDIKSHAFLDKITEEYIDSVITQKVNNAIQNTAIVNNAVTTIEGTVLDGRMGKSLQDQITQQNNNIAMKATGEFKKFDAFQEGWYRFAKFQCGTGLSLAKGASGNSVIFSIKFAFNNSNNMSALGVLNSSYQTSNINILGSSISSQTISKLRHVIDESNNNAYLEFYYNSGAFNAVAIELINTLDTNIKWTIMDKLEPTQETVENVVVYSTADLVTKNRNVVINSDFSNLVVKVDTIANKSIEIPNSPTSPNYIPVITSASGTVSHQTTISYNGGKWYAYSNYSQNLQIYFYKIPN